MDTIAPEFRLDLDPSSPGRLRGELGSKPGLSPVGAKYNGSVGEDSCGERTGRATPDFGNIMFGAIGELARGAGMLGGEKPNTVVVEDGVG